MTEETDHDQRGRRARSPTQIPWKGWKDILWRVYGEVMSDNILLVAAGVTFYLLLAMFPALAAFVSLFGLFADPGMISDRVTALEGVLPAAGIEMIQQQLTNVASQQSGALTFGFLTSLAIAFWTANGGVKALFEALNIAYEEKEKRSFVRLTAISFAFTLAAMLIGIVMLIAVAVVPAILAAVNLSDFGTLLLRLLRWPILLVMIASGLAVLYRFGPSRTDAKWRWVTWGSALATAVWLASSVAFTIYLENFADYNAMYGSLGALVGFMLWIWISALIVIVGAELNAEMEHQTAEDTTVAPVRPMGERGAVVADTLGRVSD